VIIPYLGKMMNFWEISIGSNKKSPLAKLNQRALSYEDYDIDDSIQKPVLTEYLHVYQI